MKPVPTYFDTAEYEEILIDAGMPYEQARAMRIVLVRALMQATGKDPGDYGLTRRLAPVRTSLPTSLLP